MPTNTETKVFTSLARRTKASNAKFASATKAEKRVMIAKDVIKAIDVLQIKPTHGSYLATSPFYSKALGSPEGSFQDLLPEIPACTVCAKGAIFVCTVARQNQVTNDEAISHQFTDDRLSEDLGGVFSASQLGKIESAFETWDCDRYVWGNTASERMRNIMKNIVKNKGTFIPKQRDL